MLGKNNTLKTLTPFIEFPHKEFELRQIARNVKLSPPAVKTHIQKLLKEELIIKSEKEYGTKTNPCYSANTQNKAYILYKQLYNKEKLTKSGVIEHIYENILPGSIVLFGSFQRGEDSQNSDIDIFVESSEKIIDLQEFEKKLNKKIELHFKEDFKKYPDELKNNIVNGETLKGFLEAYDT
jgi:predicted nucleotidyltransferase